jgi:glycosyltransferase involved in cell wall biosynthesis
MNKKIIKRFIVLLIILLGISVSYKIYLMIYEKDFIDHNFLNIQELKNSTSTTSYSFAIVSSIKNSDDIFKSKIINEINNDEDIHFIISTGQAVLDGAEEKYRLLNKTLNNLQKPSIFGIGENEVSDQGYTRYYKHFGQAYFSLDYNNDYYIFLDSTNTTSNEVILSWLNNELTISRKYNHTFIIIDENPLEDINNLKKDLTNLFKEYKVTAVFYSGDTYNLQLVDNIKYYSCGKAGGISNTNSYGYVKFSVTNNETTANYIKVNTKYKNSIIKLWLGLWYGIHTLFYVHFINIIIILSALILISLLIYINISTEKNYYKNFLDNNIDDLKNKKLSIAMFTNNYFPFIGGVPISIYRTTSALIKNKNKVIIFAPQYPNHKETEKNIIRCSLLKFSDSGQFPFAIANIFSRKINKDFDKYTFDIVHVHHPFWMGKKGLKLAKKKNLPIILTYHTRLEKYSENLPFGKLLFKNMVSHKMIKRFAQKCDGIIAPTKSAKEYLENIGVSRPKLIMPTGINIEAYNEIDQKKIFKIKKQFCPNNEFLLCSVFRLSPEKNGKFLIEGLKKVKEKTKVEFKCIIIGDGPQKQQLNDQITSLKMEKNIILVGNVPPKDIYKYYLASDFFVFSSQSETQGMVLLEAMAGGCPIISIRSSGIDDVIINNFNGFKTLEDLDEWSNCVIKLLEDNTLLKKLSINAKDFAKKYSIENLVIKLETFYKTIIKQKRDLEQ